MNPILNILVYVLQSSRALTCQASPPTLPLSPAPPPKKKQLLVEGVAVHASEKRKKRERILLHLQSLKLCLCLVTTNRKSSIKAHPPHLPPSTQHMLVPATAHKRASGTVLPGGLSNRTAQPSNSASDSWGTSDPFRKHKGPSCSREKRGHLPAPSPAPHWKNVCFPCERRSQARSSWDRRRVLATRMAAFPLSHPKCFPATGRTGLVPPPERSWGTIAGPSILPGTGAQHLSTAFGL